MDIAKFLASPQGQTALEKLMAENKDRSSAYTNAGIKQGHDMSQFANMSSLLNIQNSLGPGVVQNRQPTQMPMNKYLMGLLGV